MLDLGWGRMLLFIVLFLAGRLASLVIYQACWSNSIDRRFNCFGPSLTFFTRPTLWLLHLPIIILSCAVTWQNCPRLQSFAVMASVMLALGSVLRFGAADLSRFFLLDRGLALGMSLGVYFSPAFVYPNVLVCCCLQYTISGWKLGPGYSNLLGYEFIRGTSCVLAICIAFAGLLTMLGWPLDRFEALAFAVVMGFQATVYVNHALAKAALGKKWYSWILENRVQCLVVNAYLRGWANRLITKNFVLQLASGMGKVRVWLCAAAFGLEIGFLLLLAQKELAYTILLSAVAFHVSVFFLTGLLEVEYVANHMTLCLLIGNPGLADIFTGEYFAAAILCSAVTWVWVAQTRMKILDEYQRTGAAHRYGRFGDAADLLMAWWDSPFMRMFSFSVETRSGKTATFPVTGFSPYDTALTDIHTHIMMLNAHSGLDPQVEEDRKLVRTGVWGLVRTISERDFLYSLMDSATPDLSNLRTTNPAPAWEFSAHSQGPEVAIPLADCFRGINRFQAGWWFRLVMRWPHFPGEDLVPDACPLVRDSARTYALEEPLVAVTMSRIKTLYTGDEIVLIENEPVGVFRFENTQGGT